MGIIMPDAEYKQSNVLFFTKSERANKESRSSNIHFEAIELNPETPLALQNTLQEKIYLQQLEAHGHPITYQLKKSNDPKNDRYYLQSSTGEIIEGSNILGVYAFVILKIENRLELRLGNTNHIFVADRANTVIAAGDIYFAENGKIIKITDQSGGYKVPLTDPHIQKKHKSARLAMQIVGLPMELFQPFILDLQAKRPQAILFSAGPRSHIAAQTVLPHYHQKP
jgi:hypothetical protein